MSNHNGSSPAHAASTAETQPLLRPMSEDHVSKLCVAAVVTGLVTCWCMFDAWNRDVSSQLFKMTEVRRAKIDLLNGQLMGDVNRFQHPLVLAFFQFAFMGLVFLAFFCLLTPTPGEDFVKAKRAMSSSDGRWRMVSLVVSHVFSIFWLQALMMPKQMMSLGLFAASRAVEIPTAAALRAGVFGLRFGGHNLVTSGLMFGASWLMFYSYSQLAQCLCIWSGFGVSLTGPALWIIYILVLTIPAVNTVCQESVMVQLKMHPLLMLAVQNLCACIAFVPILVSAVLMGWEDVLEGVSMIMRFQEGAMLVIWLCVQMATLSAVSAALIYIVDSFWAVALRSVRVVYWWIREVSGFYLASSALLSIEHPHASRWSFVLCTGVMLALGAVIFDSKEWRRGPLGLRAPSATGAAATATDVKEV